MTILDEVLLAARDLIRGPRILLLIVILAWVFAILDPHQL